MAININPLVKEFKHLLESFASDEADLNLETIETALVADIHKIATQYIRLIYEDKDRRIRENKKQRKEDGLVIERRGDKRQILTMLGSLEYERTYYKCASGGYDYPIDDLAGIESYSRISENVATSLVDLACCMSYAKSSECVSGGNVTRQTVMNKIREAKAPETEPLKEKRKVTELHIDADEAHVPLQNGKNVIVPEITVYEGIEKVCKGKNKCVNALHISRYGMDSESLWKLVYSEMEKKYSDLDKVKVYLHSDGGNWIMEGLNWLPTETVHVLDQYHVNKYITQAVSGMEQKDRDSYRKAIKEAFKEEGPELLKELKQGMLDRYPGREKTINVGMDYLITFFKAIHIKHTDEHAKGGSSEPHVQHVLADRLTTRPMGWSEKTLKHLVSILAAKQFVFEPIEEETEATDTEEKPMTVAQSLKHIKAKKVKNCAGMIDPDNAIQFPAIYGKSTILSKTLINIGRS